MEEVACIENEDDLWWLDNAQKLISARTNWNLNAIEGTIQCFLVIVALCLLTLPPGYFLQQMWMLRERWNATSNPKIRTIQKMGEKGRWTFTSYISILMWYMSNIVSDVSDQTSWKRWDTTRCYEHTIAEFDFDHQANWHSISPVSHRFSRCSTASAANESTSSPACGVTPIECRRRFLHTSVAMHALVGRSQILIVRSTDPPANRPPSSTAKDVTHSRCLSWKVRYRILIWFFIQIIKLYKARSRLYRRQILQEHIRWKALDEIYKMYMLSHRLDLNISAKFRRFYFAFST